MYSSFSAWPIIKIKCQKKSYFAHNNDATKILSIGNSSMKTLALTKKKKTVQNTAHCWQKKFERKLGSLFVDVVMEHVDRPVNLILNPKGI